MRFKMALVLLTVFAALGPSKAQTLPECSERELDAGTVLPDGTVAGEKQALAYFKEHEPDLHEALAALDPAERRQKYGKYFMWFQRVGNCRKHQKAEMIRQLKTELKARQLSAQYRAAGAEERPALRTELETALRQRFDSDLRMMEGELRNLQGQIQADEKELAKLKAELDRRRQSREEIIAAKLKELLAQP